MPLPALSNVAFLEEKATSRFVFGVHLLENRYKPLAKILSDFRLRRDATSSISAVCEAAALL
jgi:hypothetical protein